MYPGWDIMSATRRRPASALSGATGNPVRLTGLCSTATGHRCCKSRSKPAQLPGGSQPMELPIALYAGTNTMTIPHNRPGRPARQHVWPAGALAGKTAIAAAARSCSSGIEEGGPVADELATAWRLLKVAAREHKPEALDDEYHNLFIGIGRGELVPYASWYLTGFLMDRPLAYLRRDLNATRDRAAARHARSGGPRGGTV